MSELSASKLRDYLHYDQETGIFTRKIRTANRSKVGDVAGSINGEGYRYIRLLGVNYKANRLAWLYVTGEWPDKFVDHRNGDKGDDRFANLRLCDNAMNCQNRINPKGAYKLPCGKFFSVVTVLGERHYLGRFSSEVAARSAYAEAKRTLHPFQAQENIQ